MPARAELRRPHDGAGNDNDNANNDDDNCRELQRRRTTPASAKQRRPHHGAGNDSDDADNDDDNYGNKLNSNSNHTAIAISLNDGTAGADPLPAKAGLAHHLVVRAVP